MKKFNVLKILNSLHISKAKAYTFLLRSSIGHIGRNSIIIPPFKGVNLEQLCLGENSRLAEHCWILCVQEYAGQKFKSSIEIGDNTTIGRFGHIVACGEMKIGNEVAIAERVYITDNIHGYDKIDQHIMAQPLKHAGPVVIQDGVWIGDGACILPGVGIGRHSVIGSNSVVTKNIPDYCVAAGIPAKVIKKFNHSKEIWERV